MAIKKAPPLPAEDLVPVRLPSGAQFKVFSLEQRYFNERVKRYMADNHFTNVSDLQELDRILTLELMCWRWSTWVSQQADYWGDPIDEKDLSRSHKDASIELRQIKSALGIDKVTRDKVKGEDSLAKYLDNLRIRAREFGIMRESQLAEALELFNDLKGRIVLHYNCTPDERRELGCDLEHIVSWVRDVAIPRYDKVDEHFRNEIQRFWIRSQ